MMVSPVTLVISFVLVGLVQAQEFVPVVADQCFEPMSPGFCRAYFPAFFYNPLTETCECFIFGGCAPNGNNFATLEECMGTCNVRPQLQSISQTCIDIFGADDPALIMASRPINPRPIVFSPVEPLPVFYRVASTAPVPKITTTSSPIPTTTADGTDFPPINTATAASKTNSKDFPKSSTSSSSSGETSPTVTTESPTIVDTWENATLTPVSSSPSVPVVNASTIFTSTNLQTLKTIIQRLMETLRSQQLLE